MRFRRTTRPEEVPAASDPIDFYSHDSTPSRPAATISLKAAPSETLLVSANSSIAALCEIVVLKWTGTRRRSLIAVSKLMIE
jgi:hypothetical protein